MAPYEGDIAEDATIAFGWSTNDVDGSSITRATDGTIKVRRLDDGTDATGTSVTDSEDTPDTGLHECIIDTSDNANYTVGDDYTVWLDGAVIGEATVNAVLATFSIENRFDEVNTIKWKSQTIQAPTTTGVPNVNTIHVSGNLATADNMEIVFSDDFATNYDTTNNRWVVLAHGLTLQSTTIATLASQTSFTLTAGSTDDDAYNECVAIIEDASTAAQKAVGFISDYTGGSKTVTLEADPGIFTMAVTDKITILSLPTPLAGSKSVWDRLLTGATHNINTSAGKRLRQIQENLSYELGAVWVDTVNGSGGTENFENGTVGNKSSVIADARTIADSLSLNIFEVSPGSSLTLDQAYDNWSLRGDHWALALNSKSIASSAIEGAEITGIATAATQPHFFDCEFGNTTLPSCHLRDCAIEGTITLADAGDYFLDQCYSAIAGTATPSIDFGAAIGTTNLNMRHYSGGIEIKNMGGTGTDNMSLEGHGQLIINANCDPSNSPVIALRGHFKITDNVAGGFVSGGGTISQDANYIESVLVDATWDEALTGATHNIANSAGKRLRETGAPVIREETAQGSGTGNNQIQLDAGASAVDGAYDPAEICIVGGTGAGQSRLILQYDGGTVTATVDRDWKVNPAADSEFQIICASGREHVNEGLVQSGSTSTTIKLNVLGSAQDNAYKDQAVFIRSGTGQDQARRVTAYNGTTKVATVNRAWDITPDTTSAYVMLPTALDGLTAAAVVTELKASTGDWTNGGSTTFAELMKYIGGMAAGDVSLSGGVFTVKDIDNASSLFTYVVAATGTIYDVTIT